jgi:phosphoribosylanthranilate isomerase
LPEAYKAIRIENETDVAEAARFAGARLLADSKVPGELGGSGKSFDWTLVRELGRKRALVLAGGLHPENVAEAVRSVRPFGVDTASGVEGADPRRKDLEKMRRFVSAARAAAAGLDRE